MDVLIALLEKGVNLKKDNQVGLMQGIQIFLKNFMDIGFGCIKAIVPDNRLGQGPMAKLED